ncbi:SRPBCC family protein [uncultured Sneathiella sp.]|uniref:SRPBCC family protein n=1 Tax=uncultured Sneathiella sp. TaxID=879315 RepID=UPI0030ECDDE7|tara:strand:- start:52837 stop:53313 length:477 start_codon:yes stop_codon:yes gene_type:complete
MTNEKTTFVYVTYIRATQQKIFDAITRPEIAARYWGHGNVSDWKVGSKWEHVRDNEEKKVNIAGDVIEIDPPKRLVISWSDPSEYDNREAHSRVTFDLVPYEDMVRLTVTHDELEAGSGMANGISRGWPLVLSSLKSYLETDEAIDVFAEPCATDAAA